MPFTIREIESGTVKPRTATVFAPHDPATRYVTIDDGWYYLEAEESEFGGECGHCGHYYRGIRTSVQIVAKYPVLVTKALLSGRAHTRLEYSDANDLCFGDDDDTMGTYRNDARQFAFFSPEPFEVKVTTNQDHGESSSKTIPARQIIDGKLAPE